MKFSYKWLKELAGFKESPESLAEFLTLRAFEVESVEKTGNDWVLDVKVLPNRVPDASGHIGLAKEIASLKNLELKSADNESEAQGVPRPSSGLLEIQIENRGDCSRYVGRIVSGVKVQPSPQWLRERLLVCGVQPINNLVDAANYTMLETGQPLHVFDYDKLKTKPGPKNRLLGKKAAAAKKIIVRRAKNGEKITTLDEKTYELNAETLIIADEVGPIAIAGIKGGKESGVSADTAAVVLESANFDPTRIRLASKLLGLKTDASYRFEHGLDPNLAGKAINRLSDLILKIGGGKTFNAPIDFYPAKPAEKHLPLRIEYANRLIGFSFPAVMYESALNRLGFTHRKRRRGEYHVEPPSERMDIEREEDLIEEIIRMWGYEKIPAEMPALPLINAKETKERFWEGKLKDFLVGAGFVEVLRYVFTGERELRDFGLDPKPLIEVANPISPEYRFLANTSLPSLIGAVKENESRENEIRMFCLTKNFAKGKGSFFRAVNERKRAALILTNKTEAADKLFFMLKGILDGLFESFGVADGWYDDEVSSAARVKELRIFHPYRVAEIKIGGEKVGALGELHPAIGKALKMKHAVAAAEIDAEILFDLAEKEAEYLPVSRFPAVIRDIAVVIPEDERAGRVTDVIENASGALLTDSDLFDYFQDETMKTGGKKSLAFHLVFQSGERTLRDEEVDKILGKIKKAVAARGWVIR